jgi:ubiquitin C-terminal hydrolase
MCSFKNLGNTCYINATLQSLLRLRPFTAELSQPHLKHSALDASSLLKSLLSIANEVEGVHGVINPQKVKDSIGKYSSRFAGYSQQVICYTHIPYSC